MISRKQKVTVTGYTHKQLIKTICNHLLDWLKMLKTAESADGSATYSLNWSTRTSSISAMRADTTQRSSRSSSRSSSTRLTACSHACLERNTVGHEGPTVLRCIHVQISMHRIHNSDVYICLPVLCHQLTPCGSVLNSRSLSPIAFPKVEDLKCTSFLAGLESVS